MVDAIFFASVLLVGMYAFSVAIKASDLIKNEKSGKPLFHPFWYLSKEDFKEKDRSICTHGMISHILILLVVIVGFTFI